MLPLTRPVAVTDLLRAGDALKRGERGRALGYCRTAVALLRELKVGADPAVLDPCLDALASEAARNPGNAQQLLAEMFEAAQTARSNVSSQLIAQAAARLQAGTRNPAVASAIRRRQDAAETLAGLYRARDLQEQRRPPGMLPYQLPQIDAAELDRQVAKAQSELSDSDAALQEAAPNYPQLVQQVTPARDVLAALHPGEAFAGITITDLRGWIFLLRDGTIAVGQSREAAQDNISAQVRHLRQTLRMRDGALPPFDTASAEAIYRVTLGTVAPQLESVTDLVVAPSGPLLAMPFSILLTEAGQASDLRSAPWLVRRMTSPTSHRPPTSLRSAGQPVDPAPLSPGSVSAGSGR